MGAPEKRSVTVAGKDSMEDVTPAWELKHHGFLNTRIHLDLCVAED
jgi:hypothetical protein